MLVAAVVWLGASHHPVLLQAQATLDDRVRVTFSGLVLNRATNTFDTRASIANISTDTIGGPMRLVITGVTPAGVTLANPSGQTAAGRPYVTVPLSPSGLAPGQSVSNIVLKFTNPARVGFTFSHSILGSVVRPPAPPLVSEPLIEGATSVAGSGVPGAVVEVTVDGAAVSSGLVDGSGRFELTVPPLGAGSVVRATQTVAGVRSPLSVPVIVRARPPTPMLTPPLLQGSTAVTGTGVIGAEVDVFVSGALAGSGTVDAAGVFSVRVAPLVAGQQVTATQTIGEVTSALSAPLRVVAIPPPPVVTAPLVMGSTVVSGTGISGALVEVVLDGATLGTTLAGGEGNWTLSVFPLPVGGRVSARQIVAGVASAFSPQVTVVSPPPPPTINGPLVAGSTAVSGTGIPAALVEVLVNASSLGTATVNQGGTWSLTVSPLAAGSVVVVRQVAGGVSSAFSVPMIVLTPPGPPAVDLPVIAGSTALSGTGAPGATVEVFVDGGPAGTAAVGTTGRWVLALDTGLVAGQVIQVRQTVAGVPSGFSSPVTVVAPPDPPVISAPLLAGDVTVPGVGIPGASVRVFIDGTPAGSTAVNPNGTWALPLARPLVAGQVLTAIQTVAGLDSPASVPVTVAGAPLVRIDISPAPAASVPAGGTVAFSARGSFSDGSTQEPLSGVVWSSDATSVATINAGGVAKGLRQGTARITAARAGIQSPPTILTVTPPVLVRIDLTPAPSAEIVVGASVWFTARGTFSDGSLQDPLARVAWSSDTSSVAAIDAAGLATGVAPGTAKIVAERDGVRSAATALVVSVFELPPTVTGFSPTSGRVGTEVTITGTNLTGALAVSFGGVAAKTFAVTGPGSIKAVVPPGASSGQISVTTRGGSATSVGHFIPLSSPAFIFSVGADRATTIPGVPVSYVLSLSGLEGFTGLATLGVSGLPSTVSATFDAPALTAGQRTQLTVTPSSTTPPGIIEFTVSATALLPIGLSTQTLSLKLELLAGGRTALAGQFLTSDGVPIPGVLLRLGGVEMRSDAGGNFLLLDVPAGTQTLGIDANVAVAGFPIYGVDVSLTAGQATVLPTFHITPPPPPERFTPIANATADQVVTDARFPGLSVTLPQGVTIIGWDGIPKNRIAVERLTPDRLPVPPPPRLTRSIYQIYFGTPMGGLPSAPLPVTLPNDQDAQPGEKVEIWYYDAAPFAGVPAGWRMAGMGTATEDGSTVVSDPGVGIERFCGVCGMVCFIRRVLEQLNRNLNTPKVADPVDLALGQMVVEKSDLALPGRIPAHVHRTYNPIDPFGGIAGFQLGLGPGWALSVDVVLFEVNASLRRLILPGNARFDFVLLPGGGYVNTTNDLFAGAVLSIEAPGRHVLRFKNGATWRFATTFVAGVGLLVEQADRNGNRLTIERDSGGRITRLVEPAGRALVFTTSGGRIVQIQDPIGRRVRYSYSAGRLETVTDPAGGVTRYSYDSAGRILTITDARGITYLTNEYAPLGAEQVVKRQIQADGGVWDFRYLTVPALGLTGVFARTGATITDPRGNTTTYRLDSNGLTKEIVDALGQSTRLERNARGQVLTITDPLGRVSRFEYDAAGNLTRTVDPAGNVDAFIYEPTFARVTSATDPLGNVTRFSYDNGGNLVEVTDPLGNVTRIAYDAVGQPISTTDALGNITTFTYDAVGNLVRIADPLGNAIGRTYDSVSRLISQTDPRGRITRFSYDELNRITQILDALDGASRFAYDANGNLVSLTDARGSITRYGFDSMDRRVTRTDPVGASELFEYDALGNLVRRVDRKSQASIFTYDPLNRWVRSAFADGTFAEFTFDAADRLVQALDSTTGVLGEEYDSLDRLVREVTPEGVIAYSYDSLGRRSRMAVSGQPPVDYSYDANSRLIQILQDGRTVSFGYDATNRRTLLRYPNGVSTEYEYDPTSRLTRLLYKNSIGSLGDLTYQHDSAGNRVALGGSLARTSLPAPIGAATYDPANRGVTFDTLTLSFDANGNLINDGTNTYTWDARARLVSISGGVTAAFQYDPFGRRIRKTISGQTTDLLYDGDNPVQELSGGVVLANLLTGLGIDEYFTRTDGSGRRTLLGDALGSTLALTDDAGTVQTQYIYEPFGTTTVTGQATSNPFQYTGRENDGTGLYYYRARYYSPTRHRFIAEDPLEFEGGDANLYAYVWNAPLDFIDPFGELIALGPIAAACAGGATISVAIDVGSDVLAGRKLSLGQLTGSAGLGCVAGVAGVAAKVGFTTLANTAKAAKGANNPIVRQALKRGQEAHRKWIPPPGFMKDKTTLPSGRRPDAINWLTREIIELKPNNPRAIRRGGKQVEDYVKELEKITGQPWTGRVETY